MTFMIKRLLGDDFPTPSSHPIMHYEFKRFQPGLTPSQRIRRIVSIVIVLAVLGLAGYLYATLGLTQDAGFNVPQSIWRTLFFPVLFFQIVLHVLAVWQGVRIVQDERRRQTWDKLRSTEKGIEMALQVYRLSILYRLREGIGAVLLARVIFTGGILLELTAHRGEYMDMMAASSTPEVALPVGVVLMGAFMTAGLLLPLVSIGLDVTLGLLIASLFSNRTIAGILQFLVIMARLVVTVGLLLLMTAFLQGQLTPDDTTALVLTTAYSLFADQGLLFLNAYQTDLLWQMVPYSIFIGVVLLLSVLLVAVVSDALLSLAVRRAERNG